MKSASAAEDTGRGMAQTRGNLTLGLAAPDGTHGCRVPVQPGAQRTIDGGLDRQPRRFNPDGSGAFIRGPHPILDGDTAAFCAALS
jgi:hypothetical protein